MGGKFWLGVIGIAVACAAAAWICFWLITAAWYRWGFFGMFLLLAALAILAGWLVDRRNAQRRVS